MHSFQTIMGRICMIASNDDLNGENDSDRRERFRIDDIAILQVAEVDIAQSIDKPA